MRSVYKITILIFMLLVILILVYNFGLTAILFFASFLTLAIAPIVLWYHPKPRPKQLPPKSIWMLPVVFIPTLCGCLSCLALAISTENSWVQVDRVPTDAERIEIGKNLSCPWAGEVPPFPDRVTTVYQICQLMGDGGSLQVYVVLEDGRVLGWNSGVHSMIDPHAPIFKIIPMGIGAVIGFALGAVGMFIVVIVRRMSRQIT